MLQTPQEHRAHEAERRFLASRAEGRPLVGEDQHPELVGVLVDRDGGVLVWKATSHLHDHQVLMDALSHGAPTSSVRLEMRDATTNRPLVSVHVDGDAWRDIEKREETRALCDGLSAIGRALASDDTLPLVVERNLKTGAVLNAWLAFDEEQAERIVGDFTEPGRVRTVQGLHLPPAQQIDCFGAIAVVAGGPVSGASFHGPYATPEEAADDFAGSDVQWEIMELHNPLSEILGEQPNRLQRMDLVARLQDHELPQALREGRIFIGDVPDARRSPALCMAAVLIYGGEIEHLRPAQRTLEVCVAALETYAHAIRHIRPEWRTDEMRLSAVSLSGYAIRLLSSEERTEPIILAALDRNPEVLEYLTHEDLTKPRVTEWMNRSWSHCVQMLGPEKAENVAIAIEKAFAASTADAEAAPRRDADRG